MTIDMTTIREVHANCAADECDVQPLLLQIDQLTAERDKLAIDWEKAYTECGYLTAERDQLKADADLDFRTHVLMVETLTAQRDANRDEALMYASKLGEAERERDELRAMLARPENEHVKQLKIAHAAIDSANRELTRLGADLAGYEALKAGYRISSPVASQLKAQLTELREAVTGSVQALQACAYGWGDRDELREVLRKLEAALPKLQPSATGTEQG